MLEQGIADAASGGGIGCDPATEHILMGVQDGVEVGMGLGWQHVAGQIEPVHGHDGFEGKPKHFVAPFGPAWPLSGGAAVSGWARPSFTRAICQGMAELMTTSGAGEAFRARSSTSRVDWSGRTPQFPDGPVQMLQAMAPPRADPGRHQLRAWFYSVPLPRMAVGPPPIAVLSKVPKSAPTTSVSCQVSSARTGNIMHMHRPWPGSL